MTELSTYDGRRARGCASGTVNPDVVGRGGIWQSHVPLPTSSRSRLHLRGRTCRFPAAGVRLEFAVGWTMRPPSSSAVTSSISPLSHSRSSPLRGSRRPTCIHRPAFGSWVALSKGPPFPLVLDDESWVQAVSGREQKGLIARRPRCFFHAPDKNRTCARGLGNHCSIH